MGGRAGQSAPLCKAFSHGVEERLLGPRGNAYIRAIFPGDLKSILLSGHHLVAGPGMQSELSGELSDAVRGYYQHSARSMVRLFVSWCVFHAGRTRK